jgi:hypothetical protein
MIKRLLGRVILRVLLGESRTLVGTWGYNKKKYPAGSD